MPELEFRKHPGHAPGENVINMPEPELGEEGEQPLHELD